VILYAQRRDVSRLVATPRAVPVKLVWVAGVGPSSAASRCDWIATAHRDANTLTILRRALTAERHGVKAEGVTLVSGNAYR